MMNLSFLKFFSFAAGLAVASCFLLATDSAQASAARSGDAAEYEVREDVYLSREDFIEKSFGDLRSPTKSEGEQPETKVLWLTKDVKTQLAQDFDYRFHSLRARYWQQGERTAWILEEVGKDRPITFGLVVDQQKIHGIDVLIYRESRGGEIRYPFFTKQFKTAAIKDYWADGKALDVKPERSRARPKLDISFDGITGATLSVRATEKVAKVALFFDRLRRAQEHEQH